MTNSGGCRSSKAFANGRLTAHNTDPSFAAKSALLDTHSKRLHTTIDALALAAALGQTWAGVVLSCAATVAQVESNMQALDVALDEEAKTALATVAEPAELYWAARKELAYN
jgi:aryl-alcohol dehydrogenase-like predicted oxidoreductase